jgi:hypothetical protein
MHEPTWLGTLKLHGVGYMHQIESFPGLEQLYKYLIL